MSPDRNDSARALRVYRLTLAYTAVMVTVAVLLLLFGGH